MSGLFGVIDPGRKTPLRPTIDRMAHIMSYRDWYVMETHVDESAGVGLGRIGIGIFNRPLQPVWNADHTLALIMAGEFYDVDERAGVITAQSDEGVALALYERWGSDFAAKLNGVFIIAIWDKTHDRLLITNDRFGLYPHYYAQHAGRLLFSPEVKGILCDSMFPKHIDQIALAQYVRFQQVLGERTFFEDIRLLPSASVLTYDLSSTSCDIRPYWTFEDIPYCPEISFGDAVEETGRLLRRTVQHLSGDSYRAGVYLSGGLDSRTILGLVEKRPVSTLTYGARNCRDVYYASRIARTAGSEHHWFDLPDGHWVREYAGFHLDLTEGFHSWIHAHGMSTLPSARSLIDVNLTGWDGGTVMGHPDAIEPLQISPVDDAALATRLFFLFNQKFTWPSITEAEERLLYTEPMWRQVQGLAFESFRSELSPYLNYRPDVRGDYFYIHNHCRRLTQNMITMYRSHMEVRFPYFDYDLFDFLYSLPAQLRAERKLYRALIQRETPRLALIPYDHDEFLPTTRAFIYGAQAMMVKLRRRLERYLPTILRTRHTLYADYEDYLRHELRDWAEGILFDRRCVERGIFDPTFLRSLMDRHLSNMEPWTIGKIAPLITYEMMLRRLYD